MTLRLLRIALFALLGIFVAGLFAWQYGWLSPDGSRGSASGIASIGGPFTLVDQTGATRTDADFRGKLMLIYFGYTWCPDVCPTAVQVMSVALDMLGEQGEQVVPLLITVDPARDTPSHLREYVGNFHPRLVGLTGSPEAIRETATAYRVFYRKAETNAEGEKTGGDDYLMDHSSVVYLMDRDGRYLTHFTHQSQSEDIAAGIRKHL